MEEVPLVIVPAVEILETALPALAMEEILETVHLVDGTQGRVGAVQQQRAEIFMKKMVEVMRVELGIHLVKRI